MRKNLLVWTFVIFMLITFLSIIEAALPDDETSGAGRPVPVDRDEEAPPNLVCCVESSGVCSSNKDSLACTRGGGTSETGNSLCYNSEGQATVDECGLVGCVVAGQCNYITKALCDQFNGRIDPSISSQEQCDGNYQLSLERGCCVSGDNCSMTQQTSCRGTFERKDCVEVLECPQFQGELIEQCSGNRIIKKDSRGNIARKITECNESEKCVVKNGKPECVSKSCVVGGTANIEEIRVDGFLLSEPFTFTRQVSINNKILGGKNERKDGESWCLVYASKDKDGESWDLYTKNQMKDPDGGDTVDDFKKYSAGQRHYKYTCSDGDIIVDGGNLFREEVCFQNDEPEYYLVSPGGTDRFGRNSRQWAMCNDGDDDKHIEEARDFMREQDTRTFTLIGGGTRNFLEKARLSYHNRFTEATLVENYDLKHSCKAKYPLGKEFYEPVVDESSPDYNCGRCGDGLTNTCEKEECHWLGDCSYKGKKFGFSVGGCVKGAVIAEAIWLTGGTAVSLITGESLFAGTGFANSGWGPILSQFYNWGKKPFGWLGKEAAEKAGEEAAKKGGESVANSVAKEVAKGVASGVAQEVAEKALDGGNKGGSSQGEEVPSAPDQ